MNICREFQSFKKVLHFTEDPTKKSLLMSASQIDALVHTQKKKKQNPHCYLLMCSCSLLGLTTFVSTVHTTEKTLSPTNKMNVIF
jgi:hypothetical protein